MSLGCLGCAAKAEESDRLRAELGEREEQLERVTAALGLRMERGAAASRAVRSILDLIDEWADPPGCGTPEGSPLDHAR